MKKLIILFLVVLCTACSTSGIPVPTPDSENKENTGCLVDEPCGEVLEAETADMSEYGLSEDHVFLNVTYSDVLEIIENKQTAVVYIGRPTCPWCMDCVPVLNDVAKEYGFNVYYAFTRSDYNQSEAGKLARDEMVVFMHDYLDVNEDGEKALFVPDVMFLKDGEIVGNHINTVDGYQPSEREMNEEEVEQLKSIYRGYFEKLK